MVTTEFLAGEISPSRLRMRYRSTPWWAKVLVIWLISRVITTALLLLFASWQQSNMRSIAHPSYLVFSQLWDSTWYHIVAANGYPAVLPLGPDGHVTENAWAFLPAYPMLVRFLMVVTTLPWEIVSVGVSVAFSLGAALLFYRLMTLTLPAATALFSVVLFCVAPLSPIMQVSYAEPMYIFFLVLALDMLLQRRYDLLFPVVGVMALTRPSGLAFALALGVHILYRWFTRRRDPFGRADRIKSVTLTAFTLVMGFAWTLLAWAVTGDPASYTNTELAWRVSYVGHRELLPFVSWIEGARFWSWQWGIPQLGIPILIAIVLAFVALMFLPAVRKLGVDLRIWCASYALYLLAVFFPQSSTFRLLMPMFPLAGALAQPKSTAYRISLVVVSIAGQFVWLYICWWVNGEDWTPP